MERNTITIGKQTINPYVQYMYSYPHKTAYRALSGISFADYAPLLAGGGHGLYLHVPFCQAKCGYCNLFSVSGQDAEAAERYLDAVKRQSQQYEQLLKPYAPAFSQLAVGGGTPLYLTKRQIERMFSILRRHFSFAADAEIGIETAPNQTDKEKLSLLKQAGVTRVSMGIQSFQDTELLALGRQHRAKKAQEALFLLRSSGFSCVNVDFIYGIAGQTADSLLASLKQALKFEPDEIFLYPLYIKHGAPLQYQGVVPDAQAAYIQYLNASAFLRGEGFRQDSMRRFVRIKSGAAAGAQDMKCTAGTARREFSDCGFGASLALGCGGRSYLGNLHFCSPYAVSKKECLARLEQYEKTADFSAVTHGILLSPEEIKRRYVIRHILIRPGIDTVRYEQQFNSRVLTDFPVFKRWIQEGYAVLQDTKADTGETARCLALTEQGLGLSDYLGPQLISAQIAAAMREWEEWNAAPR